MSKFLFTVWPLVGHINPFMSVAKALQARGHEVAFCTNESVGKLIEDEGMTIIPYRQIDDRPMWEIVAAAESRAMLGLHAPAILFRAVRDWIAGTVPDQLRDFQNAIDSWHPDAVVTETGMWGPIVVLGETARVPVAILTTLMGCLIPGPDAPPGGSGLPAPHDFRSRLRAKTVTIVADILAIGVRRRINRIRARNGLRPMKGSVNAHMASLPLYIVPSLRELDYGRQDLPPSVHYVGACIWNRPSTSVQTSWMEELPTDRPWVHVTEGTAHYRDPFLLRAAARGLANHPMQVILTTGPQRDREAIDLGPIARNIHIEQWVNHGELLPRCSALVTTGGAGTVMTSLRAGVPLVIVPTHWDKPDNARRIEDAGLGLCLSPRRCTPSNLQKAVDRVLGAASYREKALSVARRLAENHGPRQAAELLESLVSRSVHEKLLVAG
jgi:MGT family glycosyltransferase